MKAGVCFHLKMPTLSVPVSNLHTSQCEADHCVSETLLYIQSDIGCPETHDTNLCDTDNCNFTAFIICNLIHTRHHVSFWPPASGCSKGGKRYPPDKSLFSG